MFGFARRPGRPGSRRAVLACVPGEQHSLGLTAFGVVLKDLGWSVTFLGRDVPLAAMRRAADTVSADAIVLASVLPEPLAAAAPDINELARTHPFVVGGPAAERGRPALDRRRLLRPDLLAAAHMLTLATTEGQPEEGMMLRSAAASR